MKYKEMKLGDVAEINMGQSPNSKYYNSDRKGIEFLQGIRTFGENYPSFDTYTTQYNKISKKGDILFSVRAPVGKVNWSDRKIAIGRGLAALNVLPNFSSKYVYYFLKKVGSQINSISSGTVFSSINKKELADVKILIPDSLKDQEYIGTRLALLDKKIELNNQINDNLLELANSMFKKYFNHTGTTRLSTYFLPKRGKNLLKRNVIPGDVPVVAGGLKPATYHNDSNTKSPVITISASGANAGFVQIWGKEVWSSDSSYIDSSITPNIYFWYLFLKNKQDVIFDSQSGSAQPHIYPKHIGNLIVPNIDSTKIQQFNSLVSPLFKKYFNNQEINNNLEKIKKSLLSKYFD